MHLLEQAVDPGAARRLLGCRDVSTTTIRYTANPDSAQSRGEDLRSTESLPYPRVSISTHSSRGHTDISRCPIANLCGRNHFLGPPDSHTDSLAPSCGIPYAFSVHLRVILMKVEDDSLMTCSIPQLWLRATIPFDPRTVSTIRKSEVRTMRAGGQHTAFLSRGFHHPSAESPLGAAFP
jgi:hypothetical protein